MFSVPISLQLYSYYTRYWEPENKAIGLFVKALVSMGTK